MYIDWAAVFLGLVILYEVRTGRQTAARQAQQIIDLLASIRQTDIDRIAEERAERDMRKIRDRAL